MITIEMIDEFRRRTNASYDEARFYLEKYHGDMLEAIIAYERAGNRRPGHEIMHHRGYQRTSRSDFGQTVGRFLQKLLDIRIVVTDKTDRTYNIPILFPLLLVPFWHVLVLIAIGMMILGYRFSVREIQDGNYNLEDIISRIREKAQARGK
ncbi:MAG TPA: hypothetical protein PLD49_11080 [Thermoclostridium caenicola]|uniref:DUF4342 domain-containing protein n=1 Tax=Thermoclostridium caenicola TaxID=659425 RepID=A0A1M6GA54_9FIRM|nr:hypothetical protein [Thermoclostridium caenicola]SHJ06853.1 hypothetical protein SAMN05444373_102230 [Thermoclostridium caenicola]HOK44191.1 hypothetical protein [Thermoclostridium caenicola]HOL85647.1 hypothetical protein [Thermoclostridium caenicola]HPO76601.1 hypothetical protein [Thermoclostridium caenicola]HPU22504.1 hypothetical protein [Thermoclostridium caenicola]